MGKKGSKQKTRWRTLSIGAPPGEEDEEEGLRNGFVKAQENDSSTHSLDRSGQSGYKSRRTGSGTSGTSGYGGSGRRSHKDDSTGSRSQPKIIFNEDEYTRITTPRQDVLFKKGYLSRKKPWASNASISATPSTTESQSASHSTAGRDGSETMEDQQLLDRDSGCGVYPPVVGPEAQLGYGRFYDHASGFCYEYPVMLVGPAPVPAQVDPGVLAAVPCGPVPLRPIEWINPAFVPNYSGESYNVMIDEQAGVITETEGGAPEEQESTVLATDNSNGLCNESGTGSVVSGGGSVVGEVDETTEETTTVVEKKKTEKEETCTDEATPKEEEYQGEETQAEEQYLENGVMNSGGGLYLETMQQPVHVPHVIPVVPQPYMYPGHYMFGLPLVNMNGVTIQSGPMVSTMDVAAVAVAYGKRRKKKYRRKQRRPALGNTEDDEEAEYSSECDNGLLSSRVPWTGCPSSSTTTTTTTTQPLNPECQEFQLKTVVKSNTSLTVVPTSNDTTTTTITITTEETSNGANSWRGMLCSVAEISDNDIELTCNGSVNKNTETCESVTDQTIPSSLENSQLTMHAINSLKDETDGLKDCCPVELERTVSTEESTEPVSGARTESEEASLSIDLTKSANDLSSANEKCERSLDELNGIDVLSNTCTQYSEEKLTNGKSDTDSCSSDEAQRNLRPSSPCIDDLSHEISPFTSSTPKTSPTIPESEPRDIIQNHESSNNKTNQSPKRKYSNKGSKFVREATPGPDLITDSVEADFEKRKTNSCDKTQLSNNGGIVNDSCSRSSYNTLLENSGKVDDQESDNYSSEICQTSEDKVEASTEDSGIDNQSRRMEYPITEAVKEWLRKANSPDLFITCRVSTDSETEGEDEMNKKPSKNLHGNPMSALSVNGSIDNVELSCAAEYGEFARTSNIGIDEVEGTICPSVISRKKKDSKGTERKTMEKMNRRGRKSSEKMQNNKVSSSDSSSHQDNTLNLTRTNTLVKEGVANVCEFPEKDSVAGMRVAGNSRMDSKRVNGRRTKRSRKFIKEPVENLGLKMHRVDDRNDDNDEGIVEDTVNVRTFEKGEIIVTEDGKLLTTSNYEPYVCNVDASSESDCNTDKQIVKIDKNHNISEEESVTLSAMIRSVDSIEEPDVLECWEAETIEPVITRKKMLQSRGIYCEGEAAEDDNFELEHVNIDHVQKYYRLARESATSIEEEPSEMKTSISSLTSGILINNSQKMKENFSSQEIIPVLIPNASEDDDIGSVEKIPVEEAFEVYESCYTGKTEFPIIDSKVFKEKTLFGKGGEGPIPCRPVCCNVQ